MKFLFATALIVLLFAACTKDDATPAEENGVVTNPTGDAWISLKIATPQKAFTRALNNPSDLTGTADETHVESFRAIFFDNAGNVTADKLFTRGTDNEFGNPDQPQGDAGKGFKIPATSKKILVIANPSANIPNTSKSDTPNAAVDTYDKLNVAITTAAVSSVSGVKSFMMTNAKGGLEPSTSAGADADLVLYTSAGFAENNPVKINIDRVVAKVRLFTATTNLSDKANISNAGWTLNATNKAYFPVSVRTKTYMEGTARGCISLYDQYKMGSYRIDPNYATQPDAPATGNDWTAYKAQYNYYFETDAAGITWKTTLATDADNYEYCFENTQTAAHNMWAYTTQALFKATFLPKGLKNPDGSDYTGANVDNGEVQGGDWIMVNGGYYTWDLMIVWMTKELTNKYTDSKPADYNTTLANALNAYLEAIGETAVGIPSTYDSGTYMTPADQANAIIALFTAKKAAVEAKGAGRHGAFSYYKAGLSYYPIMIKHDDEDSDTVVNELGEFGVVRNSVYDIYISKINNPGYPTIPDPDPDTPDEDDDNFLSLKINVNPWTWYTQTEPL